MAQAQLKTIEKLVKLIFWILLVILIIQLILKILGNSPADLTIIYSENKYDNSGCWSKRNVKRFKTLEKAVDYFIEKRMPCDTRIDKDFTDEEIRNLAKRNFPSQYQETNPSN